MMQWYPKMMHFLHKSTSPLCTALVFGSVDTDEAGDHPQVRPTCVRTWKAKDTPLNFITQPHRDNIISWNHTISYLWVQRQFTRFKLYRVISKLLMRMICIWRVIIHTETVDCQNSISATSSLEIKIDAISTSTMDIPAPTSLAVEMAAMATSRSTSRSGGGGSHGVKIGVISLHMSPLTLVA